MRRLVGIFALFLLLSTAAPLLACVTQIGMTREESACCQAMHGKCHGMEKMGCCQVNARTDEQPQLQTSLTLIDHHHPALSWFDPFVWDIPTPPTSLLEKARAHPPPGSGPLTTTVLRI